MNKSLKTGIAVIALAGAGVLAWWVQRPAPLAGGDARNVAAGGPPAAKAPGGGVPGGRGGPAGVEVGRVEALRIVDAAEAVGSLQSRQAVTLRPEVSGRVAALGFTDGARVRRGQLLVQLDDTLQRAQLQQAQAQAAIARTQLARNRELVAQGFVSQSAVDQSEAGLEVAMAQVALAQAQLARLRVLAPFDGQAGIRQVNVGDYVKDGADIVTLVDASQVWVDYRLPERYAARVRPGQTVDVALDALPDRRFAGRVEAVEARVEADGRALLVRARLDNRDGLLTPGMFARTRTEFGVREQALVVPEEALVPEGGKQYILRVVDTDQGPMAERLEAQLGMRVPGKVEVLQGLAAGDRVVTAGQARLMRGKGDRQPVRIIELGAAPAKAGGGGAGGAGGAPAPARAGSAARPAP
ncbi:efflux RND transporter periplasmic adaptor subunit [Rubrivivax albus]|uniref:Efflux RND transporter periplasmic adaptor subunit n=1 Tax=Rubrivivax albus TaxID=2499835 RepID=A0A3S2TLN2_9BURK|nr:efflux RND transporter periplasmic adaptor subunit [Rubrivivax albus]RVT50403.1 efflux RND transporter periplasmic adaptor subunit [Rubrivivax albus]